MPHAVPARHGWDDRGQCDGGETLGPGERGGRVNRRADPRRHAGHGGRGGGGDRGAESGTVEGPRADQRGPV
eukprot:2206850-Prorocentrum_lima.AAC.1